MLYAMNKKGILWRKKDYRALFPLILYYLIKKTLVLVWKERDVEWGVEDTICWECFLIAWSKKGNQHWEEWRIFVKLCLTFNHFGIFFFLALHYFVRYLIFILHVPWRKYQNRIREKTQAFSFFSFLLLLFFSYELLSRRKIIDFFSPFCPN